MPSAGGYGSHYVPSTRNDYYPPPNTKAYNSRPQILPPSRPTYQQPQYPVPTDLPAPRLAQAQPQQIAQPPSQSSQGTDAGPPPCDDKDGHYIVTPGSFFGPQQKCKLLAYGVCTSLIPLSPHHPAAWSRYFRQSRRGHGKEQVGKQGRRQDNSSGSKVQGSRRDRDQGTTDA